MEGDVLKIPKEIWEKGAKRLRSAAVAQFLGKSPPIRVFSSVANRLWGYEGPVVLSQISEGFFLIEFNSERLCDWVLGRSWHIHNTALVLRQWQKDISPLVFSPAASPEWITFKKVPPALIDLEGVSWLSSKIGKPMKKFVREGLDVKVCVIRNQTVPCPGELKIELDDGSTCAIGIVQMKAREYGKKPTTKTIYMPKVVQKDDQEGQGQPSGDPVPELKSTEGDAPKDNSDDMSGAKKKKKKNAGKNVELNDEEAVEDPQSVQTSQASSSKDASSSVVVSEGSEFGSNLPEDKRPNETAEKPDVMVTTPEKQVLQEDIFGINMVSSKKLTSVEEKEWSHDGHKATFDDFLQNSKPAKLKQLKFVSGVKTRHKNRQR
ncbi:hypothetical protein LINPERPRIM_LOCUS37188 [Linum perenne]